MKRTIFLLTAGVLGLGLITGCSGSSQSPQPSIPRLTGDQRVDGLHVYDTGCGESKDAVSPSQIQVGTVRGMFWLEQYKAGGRCAHAYWARFQPDALSKGSFSVTIQAGDQGILYSTPSDSRAGSDSLSPDFMTFVVDAKTAHTVAACVTIGSDATKQCLSATVS